VLDTTSTHEIGSAETSIIAYEFENRSAGRVDCFIVSAAAILAITGLPKYGVPSGDVKVLAAPNPITVSLSLAAQSTCFWGQTPSCVNASQPLFVENRLATMCFVPAIVLEIL